MEKNKRFQGASVHGEINHLCDPEVVCPIGADVNITPMSTVVQFRTMSSALPKQEQEDARHTPRRRVLKAGVIASNDRHLTTSCIVRDLSESGARLKVEGSVCVPDTFELIIDVDGLEADCEVAWRSTHEVGVRFLGAPKKVTAKRVQVVNPIIPPRAPSLRRKPVK